MEKTPSVAISRRRASEACLQLLLEVGHVAVAVAVAAWPRHRRMPSMIEAWLSSSLMTASSLPSRVSKSPPLASKHDEYRIVSSVCRKPESRRSSSLCTSWVPQMKRTLAMP